MLVQDIGSSDDLSALLRGEAFTEQVVIRLEREGSVPDRLQLLSQAVAGKNVIHLGFCDHAPSIDGRIRTNRWLHNHLRASAKRCLGVDINAEAIEFLKQKHQIEDVVCADICSSASQAFIRDNHWDVLLIPEVLEHIGNPVSFLQSIARLHGPWIERVIITVPNAFRAGNFRNALRNQEAINSDHRYFFTPYTLMKVATDAGLALESLRFARFSETRGLRGVLKHAFLRRVPALSENLVLTARFSAN